MPTILVVDDESHILELARLYLEKEGYAVETASNGPAGLQKAEAGHPALVVLDVMLPGVDGFEVCRRLRRQSDVPIIMLTARGDDVDKIVGLEIGADDYLTKPFNPRELVARVKAVLRRVDGDGQRGRVLTLGNLAVDVARRDVTVGGRPVTLRTREFDLLVALLRDHGVVLTRERLLESVWGYEVDAETRTVDVHINHLREKLADSTATIETVRGLGYKLVAPDARG
ncbi:MAG: response regulator transcription factor [Chloroflexi bacterium]|nr:response regulator transcription factor [Chloroflexota bacterium]